MQYFEGDIERRTLNFLGILFEQAAQGRRGGWLECARTARVYFTDSVLGSWGGYVLCGVRGIAEGDLWRVAVEVEDLLRESARPNFTVPLFDLNTYGFAA
ncbi:hypothetical protein LCGC14_0734730 [marine sediment metagenome]|uniref:Uncharacterized protein n=1 Tax=marine sediment metagenome TaxID=412755 RepID=A0A0F9STQ9_9ZZZZ